MRISFNCSSATYSFWIRVSTFCLWARLLYLAFYGSSVTLWGNQSWLSSQGSRTALRLTPLSHASAPYLTTHDSTKPFSIRTRGTEAVMRTAVPALLAWAGWWPGIRGREVVEDEVAAPRGSWVQCNCVKWDSLYYEAWFYTQIIEMGAKSCLLMLLKSL